MVGVGVPAFIQGTELNLKFSPHRLVVRMLKYNPSALMLRVHSSVTGNYF